MQKTNKKTPISLFMGPKIPINDQLITYTKKFNIKRITIPVFLDGKTRFTHSKLPFTGIKIDISNSNKMIKQLRNMNCEVFLYIDLLRWSGGNDNNSSIFDKYPNLLELDTKGSCELPYIGKFASPFNDEVRFILKDLMAITAMQFPNVSGFLVKSALPTGTLLGYSETARLNYLKVKNIDPLDISDSNDLKLILDWYYWRFSEMLITNKLAIQSAQNINPNLKFACIGFANHYQTPIGVQATSLEDWMNWIRQKIFGEVILQFPWEKNSDSFNKAYQLIKSSTSNCKIGILSSINNQKLNNIPGILKISNNFYIPNNPNALRLSPIFYIDDLNNEIISSISRTMTDLT
jgi:hypothetical protein